MILTILFGALFVTCSIVHLFLCFKESEKWRKITKCFLMPLLLLSLVCYPVFNDWCIYVIIALFFGFVGDALLVKNKSNLFFALGTIAFIIGHVFYIVTLINTSSIVLEIIPIIIISLVSIVYIISAYFALKKQFGKMAILGSFYTLALACEMILAIMTLSRTGISYGVMTIVGIALFTISDTILTITNFIKDIKGRDFYIMSTYILAQAFLSIGLFFTINSLIN